MKETLFRISPSFIDAQPHLNWHCRARVVDWLVEVCIYFGMPGETLYRTVGVFDRFLMLQREVRRDELQLLGCAALWISSKLEDSASILPDQLVDIAAESFTLDNLIAMEARILQTLQWCIVMPIQRDFIRIFTAQKRNKVYRVARYLSVLTLLYYERFVQFLPSVCAATVCHLACTLYDEETTDTANPECLRELKFVVRNPSQEFLCMRNAYRQLTEEIEMKLAL